MPEIIRPTEILSKLHDKTHFKAATSVFLNHQGSLRHKEGDENARMIEKILNDNNVKHNLINILDKTSKHVSRLRENHTKTPELSGLNTNRNLKKVTHDSKNNERSINYDFNDRLSTNIMNSSVGGTTDASPFASAMRVAAKKVVACQVENNPIREIIHEEGRNLSPSQVAREMLQNCRVMRRKDFTVSPLKAGDGNGKDPNSPSMRLKNAKLKTSLAGTKSALEYSQIGNDSPIMNFSVR